MKQFPSSRYVDSIGGADCAGLATLFLSCPDDTPVWAAVTALMAHCIEQQLFPKRTYVWISSLWYVLVCGIGAR